MGLDPLSARPMPSLKDGAPLLLGPNALLRKPELLELKAPTDLGRKKL